MTALPPKAELDGSSPGHNQGVFKAAVGGVRDFLAGLFGSTGNREDAIDALRALDPLSIFNLSLVPSVGANALTVNVKTRAGAAPSAADPVMLGQRSVTPSAGDFNLRKITADVALTISSGSTLGHGNSDSRYIYWYLIDNAGAQELAVSSKFFGLSGIASTTAEGGAGAADSATVMYSATARSNVPFRCVGRMRAPQTTAGTWAALPTLIELVTSADDKISLDGGIINGNLTMAQAVSYAGVITPPQLIANQNDYDPTGLSTAHTVRLSTDGTNRVITGVSGGSPGRRLVFQHTAGAGAVVLPNDDAGSTPANRFSLTTAAVRILSGEIATLEYDGVSNRWRVHHVRQKVIAGVAKNLKAQYTGAASIGVTADELVVTDSNGDSLVISTVNTGASITVAGAGGLDTGAEAANTWYYIYVIVRPDGTVNGLLSTSSTNPVLPAGYTHKALVSAVRNDGASNFINYTQKGKRVLYAPPAQLLTGGTATVETAINLTSHVPPIALTYLIQGTLKLPMNGGATVEILARTRYASGVEFYYFNVGRTGDGSASYSMARDTAMVEYPNWSNETLYYMLSASTGSPAFDVIILGYTLPSGE